MVDDDRDRRPWYRQIGKARWKAFGGAWIGYLLDGFDFVLITLVLTEVAEEFGLDPVEAASLVSAAFVTRWLGGAVLGAIGDRYGRRKAMVVSIWLFSLGTLVCGFAWNYESLFAARLVIGLGMAGEYSASATYVMESWPARLRGRASGFLVSGYSMGTVLAAEVYSVIVPEHGWRWMFYLGVLPVVVALWVRRALPEAEDWEEAVADTATRPGPFRPLFTGRRRAGVNMLLAALALASLFGVFAGRSGGATVALSVLAGTIMVVFAVQLGGRSGWTLHLGLIVTVFAAFLYSWPIQALLPTYLKTELGYTPEQVAQVLYYAGFGTMAGCWMSGFTGDRFGPSRAYAWTLSASLAFVFPVFAVQDDLPLLGVLLFVLQALGFGVSGLLPRYIGGHFPTVRRAAGLGFTYNVGALGGAVAPVLGARLAQGMTLGTALAVLTFGLSLAVVVLVGFDVPRRLHRWNEPGAVDHLGERKNR
ncbi:MULTISPECIES: sialate:H+ symport family MFS transporter [unclassified Streptomyces]|uniref:sialate:H+ symport family MFS transporter n=1 Tax=unclassified Streptomyces TaxID=2593676 RepID=UPI003820E3A1